MVRGARNQRHPCLRIDFQRVHLRIARSAKEHPEQRHGTKNATIPCNFSYFLSLRLYLEVFMMTTTILNPTSKLAAFDGQPAEVIELIRGREKKLLAWLAPLVRQKSVTLDMHSIQRIDAAGISALVSLYASARQAGHRFSVANLSPRVAEVLALVGLERILIFHRAAWKSDSGPRMEQIIA
jgi:anti-anti-sigma factor